MPSTAAEPLPVIVDPPAIDEAHVHVVAAVLREPARSGRFLIAQRQRGKHLAELWEFPGGKLEPGESRWAGLCRELREEIAIEARAGAPLLRVYCRYPEVNVLLDVWTLGAWGGSVRARERQRLRWISIDEVGDYAFPPADWPVLERLGAARGATGCSESTGNRRLP